MTDIFSVRHEDQRAISSADQVEMLAIRYGTAVADAGAYDERLSGELDDLEIGAPEADEFWSKQDVSLDDEVGGITTELSRRADSMGAAYPFRIDGGTVTYLPSDTGFYEYCLAISQTPSLTTKPFTALPRSFERVVANLIQIHLGDSWKSLHTGHPRDAAVGTTFYKAMKTVSAVTSRDREWRWDPDPRWPPKPGIGGDGGMDFIVWRPAPDGRIGQLYVVGQCACGNDWPTKFHDLRPEKLQKWMRVVSEVPYTRCFTTPFLLSDGNFAAAHNEAGWVLDRMRLTFMAEEAASHPRVATAKPLLSSMLDIATLSAA